MHLLWEMYGKARLSVTTELERLVRFVRQTTKFLYMKTHFIPRSAKHFKGLHIPYIYTHVHVCLHEHCYSYYMYMYMNVPWFVHIYVTYCIVVHVIRYIHVCLVRQSVHFDFVCLYNFSICLFVFTENVVCSSVMIMNSDTVV